MFRKAAKALLASRYSRTILSRAGKSDGGMRVLNAISGNRGVFSNFEQGWAEARRTGLPGHSDPSQIALHMELSKSLRPSDYAALFWLRANADGENLSVFDFGGNGGNLFYSYSPYLNCLTSIDWTVFDIPSVIGLGRKIAAERNAEGLSFASSPTQFRAGQVLLASGFFHYWEENVAEFVRQFAAPPAHIIINRTPIGETRTFITVQRTATCAVPCIVRNRAELISDFASLGYRLVDRWAAPELRIFLPLFPEHSVPHYSGFYFRREGTTSSLRTSVRDSTSTPFQHPACAGSSLPKDVPRRGP